MQDVQLISKDANLIAEIQKICAVTQATLSHSDLISESEISITKFQLESFVHQKTRLIARGEILPEEFNQSAPNGITVNVIELEEIVRVEAQITKQIPLINKQIELNSSAESMMEIYEFQE